MIKTVAALRRSMTSAGLAVPPDDDRLTATVSMADGTAHGSPFCRVIVRRTSTPEVVPVRDLGVTAPLCPECENQLIGGVGNSDLLRGVVDLLSADAAVRTVYRRTATNGRGAVRVPDLTRSLDTAAGTITRVRSRAGAVLTDDADRISEQLDAARVHLAAYGRGGGHQETVLARVRDQLVPSNWRGRLTLDATPSLVAVISWGHPAKKVTEVLEAFTVRRPAGGVLLHCPRYVGDFLHRYYESTSEPNVAIMTFDVSGLHQDVIEAAASLWDPSSDGPLCDLTQALAAAGQLVNGSS
jgi:hypothetical protein